jgi:hypothetical protein
MAPTITNDDKYATKDEKTGMDICHYSRIGRIFLTQFFFETISMQLFCLSELPMAS